SLLSAPDRGLRKGTGFHFDLVLLGVCAVVCATFGLPWMCAAAVQSLAHSSSLTIYKRRAPGERDQVDFVIEQRLTTIGVAILTGACTLLGFVLKNIPLAVLFGIFLYLGVTSMLGVQFLHRLTLILLPQKYYPDYPYCQQVSMWRMHFFSFIQLSCLIVLWLCKNTKSLSLAFPFLLMMVAILRKVVLSRVFDDKELAALDGHDEENQELESDDDFYSDVGLPM
uniref:Bicarbonate transporter-like transmembrane domain-containing protein n=1 Tax=Romanomermis culicivorax TaxID=13658 RepID=A0A915KC84_ROMCU